MASSTAIPHSGINLYNTTTPILQPLDGVIIHHQHSTAPGTVTRTISQSMPQTDPPPPPPPPPPPTSPPPRSLPASTIPYYDENYNNINNTRGNVNEYRLSSSSPDKSWKPQHPRQHAHRQQQQHDSGDGSINRSSSSSSSKRGTESWTGEDTSGINEQMVDIQHVLSDAKLDEFKSSQSSSLLEGSSRRINGSSHSAPNRALYNNKQQADKVINTSINMVTCYDNDDDSHKYSMNTRGGGMCATCEADGVPPGFCMHNSLKQSTRVHHDNTIQQQDHHTYNSGGNNNRHQRHRRPRIEVFLQSQRAELEKYLGNADLVEKSFQFVYSTTTTRQSSSSLLLDS